MKKHLTLILVITIALGFAGALYAFSANKIENSQRESQEMTEQVQNEISTVKIRLENQMKKKNFVQLMRNQGYYPDEISQCMKKLFRLSSIYNFSEQQWIALYDLVEKNYNFSKVLDIYIFALDTSRPHDLNYVKALYNEASTVYTNSPYWIEEAYNRMEGDKHGVLTEGDIHYYIEQGLSNEELYQVNILSRKSDEKITDILDKKISGMTWNEITQEIYGEKICNIRELDKTDSLKELMECVYYAEVTGDGIEEITDAKNPGKLSQKAKMKMNEKIQLSLDLEDAYQIPPSDSEEIILFAVEKLKGASRETIQKYIQKGYLIRELEEMQTEAAKFGLTLEEYLK